MREQVWSALKASIVELFPELATCDIEPQKNLRDLGANSVDRAEIIMLTLNRLKLKIPLVEFVPAKNIQELIDIFNKTLQSVNC